MVDRKLTGAHYGLKDWIVQRITAVIMLVYTVLLVILLFYLPQDYPSWQQFFSYTIVKLFTQVTIIAIALHAWIGVRDIWMDYVKPMGLRLTLHVLTILWLLTCFIFSVVVIWGV